MLKKLGFGTLLAFSFVLRPDVAVGQELDSISVSQRGLYAEPMPYTVVNAVMRAFAPFGPLARLEQTCLRDSGCFPDQAQNKTQPPPSPNPAPPSLPDLFPPAQTQGNAQAQARLDKRTRMLKMHQRLGLITTVPLLATVISGSFAGGKHPNATDRDIHAGLGAATAGLYFSTAYFSIFAPRIPGTKTRGPIRWHKALAFVHGPGMILTPILGIMAFDQLNKGEKVHGIAKAHGAVGYVTAAAYGAAIVSVSFRF
jgi:hypothetical protein